MGLSLKGLATLGQFTLAVSSRLAGWSKLLSNVAGPVEVRIEAVMAGFAYKMALILAVALAYIPALGTLPTCVPGINFLGPDPSHSCLVVHKLEQPGETPSVHPAVLGLAFSSTTPLPDVFQVLEHYHGPRWNAVHYPTRQNVVTFLAKPIDLPTQNLQLPPSRLGAFALQDLAIVVLPMFYGPPFLRSQELIELPVRCTEYGRSSNTEINSDHEPVRDERFAFSVQDHMQEQSILPVPNQFRRTDLPFCVLVEVLRQTEPDGLASNYGGKSGPTFFESNHRGTFAIIANCLSQRMRAFELLRFEPVWFFPNQQVTFLLKGTDRTEGFGCFANHSADELRRELGQGSFLFIAHLMDSTAVGGFGGEGLFSSPVESLCELGDSGLEGLFGFGSANEFELQRHIHIHLLYKGYRFSFKKIENNLGKEAARNSSHD